MTQLAPASEAAAADVRRRTDVVVRALGEGARRTGAMADLVTVTASRADLLALDATIGAARAGDAASRLSTRAEGLSGEVGRFVTDVRAA